MWVPCFLAWTPVSFPSASTPAQVASLSRVAPYSFPSPSQSVEEDPDRSCTNESGKENRIRFSLYVTGFPYGTVGCHALENDLHQYFSSFAPVENVTVLSNPENGWVLCAYANFVHEIYAQAVLNAAPFGSFYGLYLSIEPARGPRTLRFSSFNHENVINISAYLEHDAPSRCASFLRRYAKSDRDATRAALSVKGIAECFGRIQYVSEMHYGHERVLDVTFVNPKNTEKAFNDPRNLLRTSYVRIHVPDKHNAE